MMKKLFFLLLLGLAWNANAQSAQKQLPELNLAKAEVEAHMRFLASDELEGRRTGSRGNNVAARYIATQLELYGVKPVPGAQGYYQPVPFESVAPPQVNTLQLDQNSYESKKDFLWLSGDAKEVKTTAVFANYGWVDAANGRDDFKNVDVKGKVVFVLPGTSEADAANPQAIFEASAKKRQWAAEKGAVALVELYRISFPWNFFTNYFGKESLQLAEDQENDQNTSLAYGWFKEPSTNPLADLISGKTSTIPITFSATGGKRDKVMSQNVIGVIEGSDPKLKNEYILLSAHYDHVGVGKQGGGAYTPQDSIFNGARDNAFGTTAVLAAAKAFAQKPPKRSVIILLVTGEEIGLLGSQYYANHPLIPLNKVVFNLNCDAAGYNDTGLVTIFGLGRTGTDEQIRTGAKQFGLNVNADPAPEQNLFDRSDNVSFAAKGIPALTFSPGFTAFDQAILQYYHQATDNPETIDFNYLHKYSQAYIHTARLIGDRAQRPTWKEGDKYEKAGKELYNNVKP
ncbi:MAG: M28 family peptidase [Saprospiraceae bacterium]